MSIYYIILRKTQHLIHVNCFNVLCNASFTNRLPEDGHDRWPKHVGGLAVYNTINVRICICTRWVFLISSSPCFTSWWCKNNVICDGCLISYDMATLFTTNKRVSWPSALPDRPKRTTIYKIFALLACYASSWTAWPLKIGQTSCPETSLTKNQSTLCNIPEKRRPHTAAEAWNHVKRDKSQDTRSPQARFKTGISRTRVRSVTDSANFPGVYLYQASGVFILYCGSTITFVQSRLQFSGNWHNAVFFFPSHSSDWSYFLQLNHTTERFPSSQLLQDPPEPFADTLNIKTV